MQVAVVQDAPIAFDREATLDKVEHRTREAARSGAELVLWPESFVSAYPRGSTFHSIVGGRERAGYDLYRRYWESAIDIPGNAVERLSGLATELQIHLVVGVVERDGGTLYCTAAFFGPEGYLGKHRKLMPTGIERAIWGFGDGSTMPIFDTPGGRIGAAICWENYMPLMRASMYAKGVQIYLAPTADARDSWVTSMQHIATEGRCFVLASNQFTRRGDYPLDFVSSYGSDPETIVTRGGSCIVDPFGNLVAGPLFDQAGILYANIDIAETYTAKFDFDVVGHYARPDIFQLHVNESEQLPVVHDAHESDGSRF